MNGKEIEIIEEEINKFKQLIKTVESGHSFSIVTYESTLNEERDIIKEFNLEKDIELSYPISTYEGGSFYNITKEEALAELEKYLREAFDFNVRFSSKNSEANKIKSEVENQIEKIIYLTKKTILQSDKIERRVIDKGGYDLVRLDFKQIEKDQSIEFIFFID